MDQESLVLGVSSIVCGLLVKKLIDRRRQNKWRNRKYWTKPWILRRNENAVVHDLLHKELKFEDKLAFYNYFRMSPDLFQLLLETLAPKISKTNTVMRQAISAEQRLSITLRYLATGESFTSLRFSYRIPTSTISMVVPEVCAAIIGALKDKYLKVPDAKEWDDIAEKFEQEWNFPNCLGSIDGKHVGFRAPRSAGSYFRNYKNFDSIVLMAVVDARYKFLMVDVGCNGRISDGGVFRESRISKYIENLSLQKGEAALKGTNLTTPYVFLADDAFPLQKYIMKPFSQRDNSLENKVFNYRLSRGRRVVENAFGILSNRFRILLQKIPLGVEKVQDIVMCAIILHNFLLEETSGKSVRNYADKENTNTVTMKYGSWRETGRLLCLNKEISKRPMTEAQEVRNKLKNYFNGVGFVPWQWEAAEKFNF